MCVYYCSTYYKAVREGGEGGNGGHVLREKPVLKNKYPKGLMGETPLGVTTNRKLLVTVDCTKLEPPGKRREEKKNDVSVTAQNGVQQTRVGWVEEAGTERDGEGTDGCASFRPTSLARAARPPRPVG